MQKMTIVLGLILTVTAVATGVPRAESDDCTNIGGNCQFYDTKCDGRVMPSARNTCQGGQFCCAPSSDLEKLHPADGVPGATSQWNPTDHSAGKAFIDNPRVGWCSIQGNMPESIWMKFHRGVKIRKLTFQSRRDAAYDKDEPINFDVFGSNNEDCKNQEHWVILATDNSGNTMTKDDTKMIYIPNSMEGSYRCYGIRVRAVHVRDNGEQFACISHIKFYSDSGNYCEELGGVQIGHQCLKFHDDQIRTFEGAKAHCASSGSQLASLQDPVAVIEYKNANYDGGTHFFVGGSDALNEGTWKWLNGKSFDASFPWGDREPSGDGDCLLTWGTGTYNDVGCHSNQRFICELGGVS